LAPGPRRGRAAQLGVEVRYRLLERGHDRRLGVRRSLALRPGERGVGRVVERPGLQVFVERSEPGNPKSEEVLAYGNLAHPPPMREDRVEVRAMERPPQRRRG